MPAFFPGYRPIMDAMKSFAVDADPNEEGFTDIEVSSIALVFVFREYASVLYLIQSLFVPFLPSCNV